METRGRARSPTRTEAGAYHPILLPSALSKPPRSFLALPAAAAAASLLAACSTPQSPQSAPANNWPGPPAQQVAEPQTQHDPTEPESRPITRVALESGLILEDIALGNGSLCGGPDATVTVLYVGTLPDGSVFDATPLSQPATFPLSKLIDGWKEGVPGMRVGGKRRLTVPAELAYGRRGLKIGNKYVVPPDTGLVFEIELLGVR